MQAPASYHSGCVGMRTWGLRIGSGRLCQRSLPGKGEAACQDRTVQLIEQLRLLRCQLLLVEILLLPLLACRLLLLLLQVLLPELLLSLLLLSLLLLSLLLQVLLLELLPQPLVLLVLPPAPRQLSRHVINQRLVPLLARQVLGQHDVPHALHAEVTQPPLPQQACRAQQQRRRAAAQGGQAPQQQAQVAAAAGAQHDPSPHSAAAVPAAAASVPAASVLAAGCAGAAVCQQGTNQAVQQGARRALKLGHCVSQHHRCIHALDLQLPLLALAAAIPAIPVVVAAAAIRAHAGGGQAAVEGVEQGGAAVPQLRMGPQQQGCLKAVEVVHCAFQPCRQLEGSEVAPQGQALRARQPCGMLRAGRCGQEEEGQSAPVATCESSSAAGLCKATQQKQQGIRCSGTHCHPPWPACGRQ